MSDENIAEKMRSRARELEAELAELQDALKVVERFEEGRDQAVTTFAESAPGAVTGFADAAPAQSPAATPEPPVYDGVVIDFSGTTNLLQRVIRIAEAVDDEELDVLDMALCLVQRGVSGAAVQNLRSHISNDIKDHPDFVRVGTRKYRYLPKHPEREEPLTPSNGDSTGDSTSIQ